MQIPAGLGVPCKRFAVTPRKAQTKPHLTHYGTQRGQEGVKYWSPLQRALCRGFRCSLRAGLLYLYLPRRNPFQAFLPLC